ncbi:MAG TPA: carbohydrate kinase family protein [Clostridia bacterium]|nr:carbohydrate kinase family protein [Clostridia bacterium]
MDVYLYGMTVFSTVHLLESTYPKPDSYGEIKRTYRMPGGETFNSAVVLSRCGLDVKIDGPFLGLATSGGINDFCQRFGIDCSGMVYDPTFEGVQDLVLVDKDTRTVFGRFGSYFSEGKRWSDFDEQAILASKIISIDPFFGETSLRLAEFCHRNGKPYVTIDCEPESELYRHAAAVVVSNEYIRNQFTGVDIDDLYRRYTEAGDGLVIFTFGSKEMLYGRKGGKMQRLLPFKVDVAGTLGAGDTFRGGVVYGVLNGYDDTDIVKFAAATAACVCRRFPMAFDPPTLEEIKELAGLG